MYARRKRTVSTGVEAGVPDTLGVVLQIFGLSSLFPKSPLFAKYHLRYLPYDRPHRVDILSGAFIFIRTDLLRSIGGFDEDFFMYGEDIDLSYRIVKAGYSNYYIPSPIIHYKGESTQKIHIAM